MKGFAAALALALAPLASAHAQTASATIDPPRDAASPASNRALVVPSQGLGMNALFLLAAGDRPKPTVLLLHGLPGNERNFDLAQAIRRIGWNVLTFTYRGAWGSQGSFSLHHALADTEAAVAFLRLPETAARYRVDPQRIVVIGHSMGGFAAAWHAARDPGLLGVGLLDAWDMGADADRLRAGGAAVRAAMVAALDDLGHAIDPITADDIVDNLLRRGGAWHLAPLAPALARKPLLTLYARHGRGAENAAFAARVRGQPGAHVTAAEIDSDHSFADSRIQLAEAVTRWLQTLVPPR